MEAENIVVREVNDPTQKAKICEAILRALPQWFGVEQAIIDYCGKVQAMPVCAVFCGEEPAAFVALKEHNAHTAEIMVMGVLAEYHRHGMGRRLIDWCEDYCRRTDKKYLTVKTLDSSRASKSYERTRLFYLGLGFTPLEVFPMFWDKDNPCLFLVKHIENN